MTSCIHLETYGNLGARGAPQRERISKNELADNDILLQCVHPSSVVQARQLAANDEKLYEGSWFNSSNHHEFDPFIVRESSVVLDKLWYQRQPQSLREKIDDCISKSLKKCADLEEDFIYPHDLPEETVTGNELYRIYCAEFTFEKFRHLLDNIHVLVPLKPMDQQALLEVGRVRCLTGRSLSDSDLEDFLPATLAQIQSCLEQNADTGVFCKTVEKSAKNDIELKPLFTVHEVIDQLTLSRDVLRSIEVEKPSHLVLLPFNPNIKKNNEYRVFVCDGRMTGMAQQHWHSNCEISRSQALIAVRAARALLASREGDWIAPDMVLDVWIDYETEACHLIEINPGGRWCSSGSSLFEWRADTDLLYPESANGLVYMRIWDPENGPDEE